jgi:type IV pilus assembly protein PilW
MHLTPRRRTSTHTARGQTGLSLVELMVGIAIGMFIVAAATMLVTAQLGDNRRLLVETQVQQDLRAAADIVTRDLRRAGGMRLTDAHAGLATATAPGANNVFAPVTPTTGAATTQVEYSYVRTAPETGPFGFRLTNGALQTQLGGAGWQDLTDRATMEVTAFTVTPRAGPRVVLPCQRLCADGTAACWPQLQVRRYEITITGRAVSDANVIRTLRTEVRPRNDQVVIDPTGGGGPMCP